MLSFGDLETGVWGSVWALEDRHQSFSVLGDASQALSLAPPAAIDPSDESGIWRLSAAGLELRSVPQGEPAAVPGGFDQLTRVQGTLGGLGAERAVDCLGTRRAREGIALERFESVRDVAAWFEPDQGLAVLAARPRGASSHAEDLVSASACEEGRSVPIGDPRVSTTYQTDGLPARASFELWPEQAPEYEARAPEYETRAPGDEAQAAEDRPEPRPRRAAGEAIGARASCQALGLDVDATLFRWHSRGREGAGVYVLARPR